MTSIVAMVSVAIATALVFAIGVNLATAEKRLKRRPPRLYASDGADFRRAIGVLLGPAILPGNRVETLVNGDDIFPRMLEAIRNARRTICFETFIYWSGAIGNEFASALVDAARRGVRVHVLLDWMGSRRMDAKCLQALRDAGVEVQLYHELSWYHIGRLNNRTHRKLLIVDGKLGFTGGVGIAPQWTGTAQSPQHWRDNHYCVAGPVVAQMQAVFIDNWIKATGDVLHGDAYFPPLEALGDMEAQMFGSSPAGGSDSMHLMFLLAITAARNTIDIAVPYFVPDDLTLEALETAARRGVRVRVLLPGRHTDALIARRASQAHWDRLLSANVGLFEFQPTMLHCKVMVVDGHWTSVGSANFDNRSFRLNDEANLNVFSESLARRQIELFENDLVRSRRITSRRWKSRRFVRRAYETCFGLLRSQL